MSNAVSVQDRNEHIEPIMGGMPSPITFWSTDDVAPNWDAGDRDTFLRSFWKRFGNDILQAVLAASIAKVQTQNFVIEGPEDIAEFYMNQFLHESDFGRGYSVLVARGVQDYYTQDNGWFMERKRSEPGDYEGPCLGLAHLDSARMKPSGNDEFPYTYQDVFGEYHLMHRSQFIRIVDMPTPVTGYRHHQRGFCALSRAMSTAMILTLLVAMKREKLSDLPPSALAVFNNINKRQFDAALTLHNSEQREKGNAVWKTLLPLFGIDPAHPASVNFISLREVWEGFSDMEAHNVAVYTFAAAWRMDPREVWPVSSGPLGTGKEAEVQHEKAKGKSFGLLFTEMEREFNAPLTLPPDVSFKLKIEDSEEEQLQATVHSTQIGNVKSMQEAGASLTPDEVRRLLSTVYHILPKSMSKLPKEAKDAIAAQQASATDVSIGDTGNPPDTTADTTSVDDTGRLKASGSPNTASVSDVAKQTKEYGMYFGPRVMLNSDGSKEYYEEVEDQYITYALAEEYKEAQANIMDFLQSGIHASFAAAADSLYALGYLTTDERIKLSGMIGSALEQFASNIADTLQGRNIGKGDAIFVMSKEIKSGLLHVGHKSVSMNALKITDDMISLNDMAGRIDAMPKNISRIIKTSASKLEAAMKGKIDAVSDIPESEFDDLRQQVKELLAYARGKDSVQLATMPSISVSPTLSMQLPEGLKELLTKEGLKELFTQEPLPAPIVNVVVEYKPDFTTLPVAAPNVHYHAPRQLAPIVNVEGAQVHVEPTPITFAPQVIAGDVQVNVPVQPVKLTVASKTAVVKRDSEGRAVVIATTHEVS